MNPGQATTTAVGRLMFRVPLLAAVVVLGGCWSAPVATVEPTGEPRLIQRAIPVQSVQAAVVSSVDPGARTIGLRSRGMSQALTYRLGPKVSGLDDIRTGDVVRVTVAEELAVYVLRNGALPGHGPIVVDARVLVADPSYRLLKLQYSNGRSDTFKVPLGTRVEQMGAGDSVVIEPVAVLALRRAG